MFSSVIAMLRRLVFCCPGFLSCFPGFVSSKCKLAVDRPPVLSGSEGRSSMFSIVLGLWVWLMVVESSLSLLGARSGSSLAFLFLLSDRLRCLPPVSLFKHSTILLLSISIVVCLWWGQAPTFSRQAQCVKWWLSNERNQSQSLCGHLTGAYDVHCLADHNQLK